MTSRTMTLCNSHGGLQFPKHFDPSDSLVRQAQQDYHTHFTDEEMEAQTGQNNLPNLGCSGQTVASGSEPCSSVYSQYFSKLDGKAA